MKLKSIVFKKIITSHKIKGSINYHIKTIQNYFNKGNKNCYVYLFTKLLTNKLELISTVNEVIINTNDKEEVDAYSGLVTEQCLSNQKESKGKVSVIRIYYRDSTEQEYIEFLKRPFVN